MLPWAEVAPRPQAEAVAEPLREAEAPSLVQAAAEVGVAARPPRSLPQAFLRRS